MQAEFAAKLIVPERVTAIVVITRNNRCKFSLIIKAEGNSDIVASGFVCCESDGFYL